jgi:hypothetical protein
VLTADRGVGVACVPGRREAARRHTRGSVR